jgi:hypothetical protein
MAALSQLSYGPLPPQFSGELEVLGPVHARCLIVPRWSQTKLDCASFTEGVERQEVAAIQLGAVDRKRIDLVS